MQRGVAGAEPQQGRHLRDGGRPVLCPHRRELFRHGQDPARPGQAVYLRPQREERAEKHQPGRARENPPGNLVGRRAHRAPPEHPREPCAQLAVRRDLTVAKFGRPPERRNCPVNAEQEPRRAPRYRQRRQRGVSAREQRTVGLLEDDVLRRIPAGRRDDARRGALHRLVAHAIPSRVAPALDPPAAKTAVAVPIKHRRAGGGFVSHGGKQGATV